MFWSLPHYKKVEVLSLRNNVWQHLSVQSLLKSGFIFLSQHFFRFWRNLRLLWPISSCRNWQCAWTWFCPHGMSKRNQQYFRTHTRENGLEPDLPCTEGLHLNQHIHTHTEKGHLSQENHIYSQPRKKASLMQQLIMKREEKELSPMAPLNTRIRATEIVVVCKAISIKGLC